MNTSYNYVILGFHREVAENCALPFIAQFSLHMFIDILIGSCYPFGA